MNTSSNNILVKNLVEYGLGDKEAKVYLSLLELEVGTVNEVAKLTGINRSSLYVVIESLKKKGLICESHDKKIQQYIASDPEVLFYTAKERALQQEEIKDRIADIIPELKALHKDTKKKPKVRVYEGKQGLINVFEDSLWCKEKIMRVASSVDTLFKVMPDYFKNYVARRIQKNIKMMGIHPKDESSVYLIKNSPKLDEPTLIPKNQYNFPVDFTVYDNKIGLMSPANNGWAIIIEDEDMASVMKSIFDLAFLEAKRLSNFKNKK